MRVAYFVNLYPAVSHTFIRREIHALETLGVSVARFALRADASLVDEQDLAEAAQTRLLLKAGFLAFALAVLRALLRRPVKFAAVCRQAFGMGRRSERGLARHLAYVLEGALLADWCAKDGVEHIHAHFGSNPAAVAMFASRLSGIPFSFTAHGPGEFVNGPLQAFDEKLRFAAFAACVSAFGRVQLMLLTNPDLWEKIALVRCGVDASYLTAEPTDCPPARRFVCVGRLCTEKAQQVLVAAARVLRDSGERCEIVFAGDGPNRRLIEDAIARENLQASVTIAGWASGERVKAEILAARALILPSFSENLPVVIMEAMALGRPVISTFVAGIPELVRPGETGWLVPASDEIALAQAMREALDTPVEKLTAMGRAGRHCVLDRHDARQEASKLKDLFEKSAAVRAANSFDRPGRAAPESSGAPLHAAACRRDESTTL